MKPSGDRILVIGPAWVGDMVMSQSLYRVLADTRPHASIDVLAPAWSQPLLARMPEVRRGLTKRIDHGELALGRRRKLGRALRGGYDQAIVLPNSIKAALVPMLARIPRRTGWRGEMRYGLLNDMRHLDSDALPLMVQRFVALGLEPGAALPDPLPEPRLTVDPQRAAQRAQRFGLDPDRKLLVLCPGAEFGGAKRWPSQHYAAVADDYLQRGWQVALFGSARDREVTAALLASASRQGIVDLAGRTSLAEAIDLMSLASAVVSNDSGLMHIAAALDRPLLVIYGATSPGFTPPLSGSAATLVSDIECAPCFERECPLGHHRCMRETMPATAVATLDAQLASLEDGCGS